MRAAAPNMEMRVHSMARWRSAISTHSCVPITTSTSTTSSLPRHYSTNPSKPATTPPSTESVNIAPDSSKSDEIPSTAGGGSPARDGGEDAADAAEKKEPKEPLVVRTKKYWRRPWNDYSWKQQVLVLGVLASPLYAYYQKDEEFREVVDYWYAVCVCVLCRAIVACRVSCVMR